MIPRYLTLCDKVSLTPVRIGKLKIHKKSPQKSLMWEEHAIKSLV